MAAGAFRAMLAKARVGAPFHVASAGTHRYHAGQPAFPLAAQAARKRGYDIAGHLARPVMPGDFDRFDTILAMDRANLAALRAIAPTRCKRDIELLLDYGDRFHGEEVPDPYGGGRAGFEHALDMIEDGCRGLLQLLVRTA